MALFKKLVACETHVAAYESGQNKFHEAEAAINQNPRFRFAVKTHAVQEKFSMLPENFKTSAAHDWNKTGSSTQLNPLKSFSRPSLTP